MTLRPFHALPLALLCAALPAAASLQLAQKNACTACHTVDKKLVGPAFQEIAKKYAGQEDAAEQLAKNIRAGGAGKWGPVPMPAQPAVPEDELKALAAWIANGAK